MAADDSDPCEDDSWLATDDPDFVPYVVACVFLVLLGGIMSGLQQGLMQLDRPTMRTLKEESSPIFRGLIHLVVPLTERRHLTLVTLLISNAVAMEALPVFMDVLVPQAVAIAFSVTMVVLFGEIIPQAVCLKWPGQLACFFSPLVWFLLLLFLPISYPIARLLDWMLGAEHRHTYSRAGLGELAREQSKEGGHGPLTVDELEIITGALELHAKVAGDICIPLDKVFMLSFDSVLNDKAIRDILDHGHSRVPVWRGSPDNIVGLLLVKHLIRINADHEIPVRNLQIMPIFEVDESVSLFALLRRFRTGTSHMAAVTVPPSMKNQPRVRSNTEQSEVIQVSTVGQDPICAVGIVTLEDVIEQLIKHDIEDETDVWKPVNARLDARMDTFRSLRANLLSTIGREDDKESQPLIDNSSPVGSKKTNKSKNKHKRGSTYGSLNEFSSHGDAGIQSSSDSESTVLRIIDTMQKQ